MPLTNRFQNIVGLVAIQVLLFVLYAVRLHLGGVGLQRLGERRERENVLENINATVDPRSLRDATGRESTAAGVGLPSRVGPTSTESPQKNFGSSVGNHTPAVSDRAPGAAGVTTGGPEMDFWNETDRKSGNDVNTSRSNLYAQEHTLTLTGPNELNEDCVLSFLKKYTEYCNKAIIPLTSGDEVLCPCVPTTLKGATRLSYADVPISTIEAKHSELLSGGHWSPGSCTPRQRVAIIVPFRDREAHLRVLLQVLHPFLQRQMLSYTIFVVEQVSPAVFNKASLMNAGFREIIARSGGRGGGGGGGEGGGGGGGEPFDCFVFHDVDMLPEDDRNFYGCYKMPRHVGAYVDKFRYNVLYSDIFGGATAFTREQFEKVNGYSNEFYGWGGEDDDMFQRIKWKHMSFMRFPKCVARYKMIKHRRDDRNPYDNKLANQAWLMRPFVYKSNGLNSLSYELVAYEEKRLYTRILIALPKPPAKTAEAPKTT